MRRYDKTIEESYSKAVKLSQRDMKTIYILRFPEGYRALSITDIGMSVFYHRRSNVVYTVNYTPDI